MASPYFDYPLLPAQLSVLAVLKVLNTPTVRSLSQQYMNYCDYLLPMLVPREANEAHFLLKVTATPLIVLRQL